MELDVNQYFTWSTSASQANVGCSRSLHVLLRIVDSEPINTVHIVGLLETNPSSTCDAPQHSSTFALSLALAAEYVLDMVNSKRNSSDFRLSVPGVSYGERRLVNLAYEAWPSCYFATNCFPSALPLFIRPFLVSAPLDPPFPSLCPS